MRLKFGRAQGLSAEEINITPITVFVGPNNSGKSKILKELQHYCSEGISNANNVIIAGLNFFGLSVEDAEFEADHISIPINPNDKIPEGTIKIGSQTNFTWVKREEFVITVKNPETNHKRFCTQFLKYNTLLLDGNSRINLVKEQPAGDLQQPSQNSLQMLIRDDTKRNEVRRIIFEAFSMHFVIDPTHLGYLRIRFSNRPPANIMEERGIHEEAVQFHASALPIEQTSDGVKAFTGIITEVLAGDPRVLLIDEPEAFLHPALANKLGFEIAHAAVVSDKRVFISTHSAAFVMGCIQSGVPVNIVRLTYHSGIATARMLPSYELLELMRNPLLRSTGVISGLFYEFVVVTESDADRAFYQEVNDRLLRFKSEWGIPNCLFINAQNKQTVHTIIKPLRHLGIPVVGIVDIDILKEGGTSWSNLLSGAYIPEISRQPLSSFRSAIKQVMDISGLDMKRNGGVAILSGSDREAAENLIGQLAEYGIFVVPNGELESWLRYLEVKGHGPGWLVNIFERMGEDSDNPNYVHPSNDDVWKFMKNIKQWLCFPLRKGIPL